MGKLIEIGKGFAACLDADKTDYVNSPHGNLLFEKTMMAIVIYVIIIELAFKEIWMLDNRREDFKKSHDIKRLFSELTEGTKADITKIYDKCSHEHKVFWEKALKKDITTMASLEEALEWNENAMKNFKYDRKYGEKNIPYDRFAINLLNYASTIKASK